MLDKVITLLFISGDPLKSEKIAELLAITKEEILENTPFIKTKLQELGLDLLLNNEGLSITTKKEQSLLVEAFRKDELKGELTAAAIQVLTLVAYLGYPTREQISYIRGVQSTQSIRALVVRGLINKIGEICSLTTESLKQLGITKVEELPDYESIHKNLLDKLQSRDL